MSTEPSRYPPDRVHGPMTSSVVSACLETSSRASQRTDVFMKVGSADTVRTDFLHCYDGAAARLDMHAGLEPTRAWFGRTSADGNSSSFSRRSLAAGVGWRTVRLVDGDPSPLAQEVTAIRPAFAVVMTGTEDTYPDGVHPFERNLRRLIDTLLAVGVVPVVSTIPSRGDQSADAMVPEMNAVIRALAQSRQVPYVDLWRTLLTLPGRGLGADGIHLSVYQTSEPGRGCQLHPAGLAFGMNQRNLMTLQALDRMRRFLVAGAAAEEAPPPLTGHGTWDDPRVIDRLPFVDDGDTRHGVSHADRYGSAAQDESGPEIVYRTDLAVPTRLRIRVFGDDGVDVDLHWMDAPDPVRTIARADRTLLLSTQPGTYFLSVDTFVSLGRAKSGPYRLTVLEVP